MVLAFEIFGLKLDGRLLLSTLISVFFSVVFSAVLVVLGLGR